MKRIPSSLSPFLLAASAAIEAARPWTGRGGSFGALFGVPNSSPVMVLHIRRTVSERQRMVRLIRAGRECQESTTVPKTKMIRFVVMIWRGGRVRAHQAGEASIMRINRVVRAGWVVADVAVCWVERKSVMRRKGSRRMLHLVVNVWRVARISSRDLRCFICVSEGSRL